MHQYQHCRYVWSIGSQFLHQDPCLVLRPIPCSMKTISYSYIPAHNTGFPACLFWNLHELCSFRTTYLWSHGMVSVFSRNPSLIHDSPRTNWKASEFSGAENCPPGRRSCAVVCSLKRRDQETKHQKIPNPGLRSPPCPVLQDHLLEKEEKPWQQQSTAAVEDLGPWTESQNHLHKHHLTARQVPRSQSDRFAWHLLSPWSQVLQFILHSLPMKQAGKPTFLACKPTFTAKESLHRITFRNCSESTSGSWKQAIEGYLLFGLLQVVVVSRMLALGSKAAQIAARSQVTARPFLPMPSHTGTYSPKTKPTISTLNLVILFYRGCCFFVGCCYDLHRNPKCTLLLPSTFCASLRSPAFFSPALAELVYDFMYSHQQEHTYHIYGYHDSGIKHTRKTSVNSFLPCSLAAYAAI